MATPTRSWVRTWSGRMLINLFALAMHNDLRVSQFLNTVFAQPTVASDVVYTLG